MLNKYIDLLQKATEALVNIGHSGAGITEYFQAVGYEFCVIALGCLYLLGVIALLVIPFFIVKNGIIGNGFATKQWKEFRKIWERARSYKAEINALWEQFIQATLCKNPSQVRAVANNIYDLYAKNLDSSLVALYRDAFNSMTDKQIYKLDAADLLNRKSKQFKEINDSLPSIEFGLYSYSNFGPMVADYKCFCTGSYADIHSLTYKLFSTYDECHKAYVITTIRTVILALLSFTVYLMFALPLVLMLF